MTGSTVIADFLGNPGVFYRSVALERDVTDPSAGRSFVLTPWLKRGATEIISGLQANSTRRAWRVIGDFGVGKSALALALVQSLDPRLADSEMPMRALVEETGGAPRMFPLLVTGSREGLATSLSTSISQVLATKGLVGPRYKKAIAALTDPFDAIVALRDALRATERFDGLLLVVDEMGKFLEAANEEEGHDVFRLQSLAEAASRSGDAPLAVVLILHKGFQSYAEDWRSARRSEWEKVAERFEEVVFDHPLSHTAALLSAALAVDETKLPTEATNLYDQALAHVRDLGWLGPRNTPGVVGCWPIHPASIPVMARFFASFGQNERSLFGFAANEEPNGLRAFAADVSPATGFYAIHHFFDYIASSFGHRLTSRAGAGEWSRISEVLDRAADADAVETAVLKAVGVLDLIDAPDLAATAESVTAALFPSFTSGDVETAIAKLLAGGLLFRRPGRSELRLWTSRRVDLTSIWGEAEAAVDARSVIRDLPRHLASLPIRPHVLARRHSVLTGTNRRFAIRCTHASELGEYSGHVDADGGLVAVQCADAEDLRIARAWSAEVTSKDPTILAVTIPPMPELGQAVVDLLRHRWIISNAAALQEDAHASAEIERTVAELELGLVSAIEAALGLRGRAPVASIEAFWKGETMRVEEPIHSVISTLCEQIYHLSPLVENELVNKHALTSAGAGARQRLIERMFSNADHPELGFATNKNPPERALYLSMLRRGGLHREEDGGWVVRPPAPDNDPLRLAPALRSIEERLAKDGDRVALPNLYATLDAKPYGVRRGLAPLLLAVSLVAAGHRVALFERGTYCPRLDGAAFMRILKSPEHFALQLVALEGVRADVFHRLAILLDQPPEENGIRIVVDPLIRFGVELPFHVQRSSELTPEARGVRRALAQARSPIDLVFCELPEACGLEAFGPDARVDAEQVKEFVSRLDAAITELRSCYPKLLESMRTELFEALEVSSREALAERAAALSFRVREQQLRTFVLRLSDAALPEDAWTEALGGAVIGKPPARWLDHDVEIWRSKLADLTAQFQRVEAVAFGEGQSSQNAVRVSLTRSDGRERAVVVDVDSLNEGQWTAIGTIKRLASDASLSPDIVAALMSLASMQEEQGLAEPGREAESDHG